MSGIALSTPGVAEDRLIVSANGSTLTDTNGGGGGSLGWVHSFSPGNVFAAAGEYQQLGDAQWQFGSLSGAISGGPEGRRWTLSAEGHRGSGDDDAHDFTYQIAAVGFHLPLTSKLSLQLEDRQIDIDTTHGNLPKVGLTMVWTPRLLTSIAYGRSIGSGNLGTDLTTARLDYYDPNVHLILGAAFGEADAVILGLQPDDFPSRTTRQAYVGVGKTFSRTEFQVLADYLEVENIKKVTLTLNCNIRLNGAGQ